MQRTPFLPSVVMALLCASPAGAAPPACGDDIDACVRTLVLENAGFVAACASAYPPVKPVYERAFKHWSVLEMPIPGLAELMREGSKARLNATFEATEILRGLSEEQRQGECSSRLTNLTTPTPTLVGRTWALPADALKKYTR